MCLEASGKVLYRLDPTTDGPAAAALKPVDCRPFIGVAPEVTELLLKACTR